MGEIDEGRECRGDRKGGERQALSGRIAETNRGGESWTPSWNHRVDMLSVVCRVDVPSIAIRSTSRSLEGCQGPPRSLSIARGH